MRNVDVVVIGAGQAGLATSFELSNNQVDHVVLDRGRVGEAWRTRRWDSFSLVGPNWSFDLPGQPYEGDDPDGFMLRQEIVDRFQAYAEKIGAPVETEVEVTSVTRHDDGTYRLATRNGDIQAKAVVAATGAYQRRHRTASNFAPDILQLHTDEFRNAAGLNDGGVLVIGSGQSGSQIVEDLRRNGRDVWLATGSCGWIPRRYRGKDNVDWRRDMGMFDDLVADLGYPLRLACPPIQTGIEGGRDINLRTLHDAGTTLLGRFQSADGYGAQFADDLQANAAKSDQAAIGLRNRIDTFIRDNGLEAPDEPDFRPVGDLPKAPAALDLRDEGITNVIWGSGYRLDYSWIDLDLNLTPEGYPEQSHGISPHEGLYFMGLQLMHTRKSGLIFGVGSDAAHLAPVIKRQLSKT
jgi:putative flavoprotein involved in K+ transport